MFQFDAELMQIVNEIGRDTRRPFVWLHVFSVKYDQVEPPDLEILYCEH